MVWAWVAGHLTRIIWGGEGGPAVPPSARVQGRQGKSKGESDSETPPQKQFCRKVTLIIHKMYIKL